MQRREGRVETGERSGDEVGKGEEGGGGEDAQDERFSS